MLDGVFDQPDTGFDSEDIHDLIFVEGYGSVLEFKHPGDLLHALAFGEKLQNFALPAGKVLSFSVRLRASSTATRLRAR